MVSRPKLYALEKNILKYRALEMMLCVCYVEELKKFIIGTLEANQKFGAINCVKGKLKVKDALLILENEYVISRKMRIKIVDLIDYRNQISHEVYKLVADISMPEYSRFISEKYNYSAREELKKIRSEIFDLIGEKYLVPWYMDRLVFEEAENAYEEELKRLRKRIDKQFLLRQSNIRP